MCRTFQSLVALSLALHLGGCSGCSVGQPTAPPKETRPTDLGPQGLLIEQPRPGDAVSGKWVTVTGWLDPERWGAVLVMGAPVTEYYERQGGHLALPTVPVVLRPDGRFTALKVPLREGSTKIGVFPLPRRSDVAAMEEPMVVEVAASDPSAVPATAVATPESGALPLKVALRAYAAETGGEWQWDFEGDGVFDASVKDGESATRVYEQAGGFTAVARRRAGDRWIYASAPVAVAKPAETLAEASVGDPRALAVVPEPSRLNRAEAQNLENGLPRTDAYRDDTAFTRSVLLVDGGEVKVFDGKLSLKRTLSGFTRPVAVAGDWTGRVYVLDAGAGKILAFNEDGTPDTAFGSGGAVAASFQDPVGLCAANVPAPSNPRGRLSLAVLERGAGPLHFCSGSPLECTEEPLEIRSDGAAADGEATPEGLSAMATELSAVYDARVPDGRAFPLVLADRSRLLYSDSVALKGFQVVASLRAPLTSVSSCNLEFAGINYVVGADADGALREWLTGSERVRELRQQRLSFPVKLVAVDAFGTRARRMVAEVPDRQTGPLVVYAAGAGTLKRMLLSPLTIPSL